MCLAFDLGIKIFYQDTDSMHIEKDKIELLSNAFKEKYNRELIGKSLGQFHSDFEPINNHKETPYAIESIFVAKKIYMDKLTDSSGEIGYHLRGKGITQQSIKALTSEKFNGDFVKTYESLFNEESLTFDLTAGQPSFAFSSDFTVSSRSEFLRKVKCSLPQGSVEDYFEN